MFQSLTNASWTRGWVDFQNDAYVKGLVVGAVAALILSNPSMQKKTLTGLASLWGLFQGGMEEIKERFRDAEAEMQAAARGAVPTGEDDGPSPEA
ncbi:hypothetical protein [Pararhodospirillum photometricum]|nr:hypothetical protein [Pararhodospirillum photometricum]